MAAFAETFAALAGSAPEGAVSFAAFMRLALYDEACGYYRRDRPRVGRGPGTDFVTATSAGAEVFAEFVAAAAVKLLGEPAARDSVFVELGAEPGAGLLEGKPHPFATTRCLRPGDPLELRGRCVVFSNELFDAQPFHRVCFHSGRWRERGVRQTPGGRLEECLLRELSPEVAAVAARLPARAPEGWVLDLPLAAEALTRAIAAQPWSGLFLAFDYGKSWRALTDEFPEGTARAYHRHTQSNDLLARPGEQDLTCHICWDWLQAALSEARFSPPQLEFQETFFVRHATRAIEALSTAEAGQFSPRKQRMVELLHPAKMGQKFQVLFARREG